MRHAGGHCQAVRQNKQRSINKDNPGFISDRADVGSGFLRLGLQAIEFASITGRLVNGKTSKLACTPEWSAEHAPALLSASSNGQWTQARKAAVKKWEAQTDRCQLCTIEKNTFAHRRCCKTTRPIGGWSVLPDKAKLAACRIGTAMLEKLKDTGLLAICVPRLETIRKDTFRWFSDPPAVTPL